ncbi:hypothetical protein KDK95_14760 [Actinospica sp. MGRD01-02]|uniref:HEAT repeat domain-containing protein n=1 Tax=Actinospica acidithermotolerans TaxID=2828514 RepID=A0A941IJ79_9ACTN|nr:hypothetical protein [Actinospica acidithermotolerans]MBR7827577.1 hypothetical protein [Actinospica acidithermotolerans]
MTTPETVGSPGTPSPLPPAAQLYTHTDWASLGHANPFDFDLASTLTLLLHDDAATRANALHDLQSAVHHQNTIYPSTTPVALYIAALLFDPRTDGVGVYGRNDVPRTLRAALLDWLGELADDVGEQSAAIAQRFGYATTAEETALRALRPTLLNAATAFADSQDSDVRHAAVTTTLLLLDTIEERRRHETAYAQLVEEILATSSNRYHRARALDSLDAWGHDTTMLRRTEPGTADNTMIAWADEPPF